ncbi:MAG: hypothetical protein QXF88_02925 [Candidatus Aenigmatarchaeota archaeon]
MSAFGTILEVISFLITSIGEAIIFIIKKFFEFSFEIASFSSANPINMIIGSFILGLILFITGKYVFGLTKDYLILLIVYAIFVIFYIVYRFIL